MRHPARLLGLATVTALLIIALPVTLTLLPTTSVLAQSTPADRASEADRLVQQGFEQVNRSQFREALQSWEQALEIYRDIQDRRSEGQVLGNLSGAYYSLGDYRRAIEFLEQSLPIFRELDDRRSEGNALNNLGLAYRDLEDYRRAIEFYEHSLPIFRELNDHRSERVALENLGDAYFDLGDSRRAIDFHEQALTIARELDDPRSEGNALGNLGLAYSNLGDYRRAIDYHEQHLAIARNIDHRAGEGAALGNLSNAYQSLGDYSRAIDFQEQALAIARELDDRRNEGAVLGNLGNSYLSLSDYSRAIDFQEQALAIARDLSDGAGESRTLNNLGLVYLSLGDYHRAIEYHEQALAIARETGRRGSEGTYLGNVGIVYWSSGDYRRAIEYYEQHRAIARDIGDLRGEGDALGNLGGAYLSLGDYRQAISFIEQALEIFRDIGVRAGEGIALDNLGNSYRNLGQEDRALEFYGQALAIFNVLGSRAEIGRTLGNIGKLLNAKTQPELAITFLKASVDVRESIRGDIRGLDTNLQQSFTDTVAADYRLLADLLLEQGRIPEAQQVLDLLKLEELREFTNTRATWTGTALAYTAAEQPVIDAHGSLIALSSAILTCEDTNCAELNSLYDQREALTAQYNDQVNQFANTIRANRRDDEDFQDPQELSDDAKSLLSAYAVEGQTPVLIYPFVLEDKLWLVWAIEGRVIGSAEVPVTQGELANTVQRFGELLTAPTRLDELQAQGQQLYNWIIQPLEAELAANNIDHLIFVNDRVTRYIPMAALYDGEQFLAERYQISTVLTPGTTDTRSRLADVESSQVLGLGLTQAVANFNPLPAVATELDSIVQSGDDDAIGIYPGQVLLNEAFTLEALKANLRPDYQVLHLATHAAFVPGRADESFIVMGNGDRFTTADIEDMNARLDNLHLVILSACQTAVGGPAGDGAEITGISSYFLGTDDSRAETVIASLWAVNDTSTSVLMQRFYTLLATGELTKAEALRQAQLSLLYEEDAETRLAAARRGAPIPTAREGFDVAVTESGYRHPYYWAPFILIGNGL
ncbi:MAG: tetratricopeptide repeat protein [Leptolyngbya sp. SIO1E4]|nr:tetratricopeptide repeat protein [Leptolyngbya sp. SIO1E4]